MTLHAQASYIDSSTVDGSEHAAEIDGFNQSQSPIEQEQQYRASAYALLARLLRTPPDQAILDHISALADDTRQDDGDDLMLSMSALGLSAGMHTPAVIEDEFHQLFIGLGKGEVVPYASWYLTGFLMEKPLSDLRDDLARLGFQRDPHVSEPEDHAAALCEVISMMIQGNGDIEQQKEFFQAHMLTWMGRFFSDLSLANSAVFYRALGRFGAAFLALENEYFSMQL